MTTPLRHPDPVQASLLDAEVYAPNPPKTPEERFEAFHARHPEVYRMLVIRARRAKVAGRKVGMRCLWENLRWNVVIEKKAGDDPPVLNDHYPPFYARLMMRQEPDLKGFFETRGKS